MNSIEYILSLESPSAQEFSALRNKIGWGKTDLELAKISLANSLFHVVIRDRSRLIGMGRIVGDGSMYFYIQDVVVDPEFQNQGIGHAIMESIESHLQTVAKVGSTIALLSAQGKEQFYTRYGYLERTGNPLGRGMCKFI